MGDRHDDASTVADAQGTQSAASPTRGDVGGRVHDAAERLLAKSRRTRRGRGRAAAAAAVPAPGTPVPASDAAAWTTGVYDSPKGRRYVYRCPVHWGDLDAFGHVNNVRMLRYLEDARVAMLFVDAVHQGIPGMVHLIVAGHEIEYVRPLEFRAEPIRVEVWVREIRAASFTVGYEICDDDAVFVRASSLIVPYDFDHARPRRLAPDERTFLEAYLEREA